MVILGKFFKKLFSEKKNTEKKLRTCIKNSLKRTNHYKLIKILKKYDYISIIIHVYKLAQEYVKM